MSIIRFLSPTRDSANVSQFSLTVIREIMNRAGISEVLITSATRTAHDQARIMFDNLESHGISSQKKLYGRFGDEVIDHYQALKGQGLSRQQIISAMTTKISQLGPGRVSRHAGDPSKINVIDIAPSSVPESQRKSFVNAVEKEQRVQKFLKPPTDPAYHLEISQPGTD